MQYQLFKHTPSYNNIEMCCELVVKTFLNKKIVIVKELSNNPGGSICNVFESLCGAVCEHFDLDLKDVIWIEHWPTWSVTEGGYDRDKEDFYVVDFDLRDGHAQNPNWTALTPIELDLIYQL